MSSRSIDTGFGRTGWDFLYAHPFVVLAVACILFYLVLSWIRPEAADTLIQGISDNLDLLVPVVGGFIFGRFLYFRVLRQYVVLQVEDPEHNRQAEYEISLVKFRTMTVEDGIMNPVATAAGVPLYRVLYFDPINGIIRAGDCHDPKTDLASVMVRRECWRDLVAHDHDRTVKAEELMELRYQEVISKGSEIASELLEAFKLPSDKQRDKDRKEESEVVPDEDQ